jgi:hypothetical protein
MSNFLLNHFSRASNEKTIKSLQMELNEKKAEIEKNQLKIFPFITESQENTLISQLSK